MELKPQVIHERWGEDGSGAQFFGISTAPETVGVPEITQVELLTLSPEGNAVVPFLIAHPVMLAPLVFSTVGAMLIAVFIVPVVPVAAE